MRAILPPCTHIRRTSLGLLLGLVCGALVNPSQAAPPPPTTAVAAIVIDAETGAELWSREPDRRMFPASTTKMMTGALAAETGDLDRIVTVGPAAASIPETGLGLQPQERLPFHHLLQGALIWSANDASGALAEAVAGSIPAFVERMNQRARELGATHTHFVNPHGLHDPNHYSTARDLATIAAYAMRSPEFRAVVATQRVTLQRPVWASPSATAKTDAPRAKATHQLRIEPRVFSNRNRLLLAWDACDGIKSGYTRQAGRCLVTSTVAGGRRYIAVVLHSARPTDESRALLEWAGRNFESRTLARGGEANDAWQAPVTDGRLRRVPLVPAADLAALSAVGAPQPAVTFTVVPAIAPVRQGARLGVLQASDNGRILGQVALVAQSAVPLSLWGEVKHRALPNALGQGLLWVATGVLLLGTAAKAARTRRRRLPPRQRAVDTGGKGRGRRTDRLRARSQGRPRVQRDRG